LLKPIFVVLSPSNVLGLTRLVHFKSREGEVFVRNQQNRGVCSITVFKSSGISAKYYSS